jgi:SpoVK/Ycf46/Vps4 family AAA+-type ATPase
MLSAVWALRVTIHDPRSSLLTRHPDSFTRIVGDFLKWSRPALATLVGFCPEESAVRAAIEGMSPARAWRHLLSCQEGQVHESLPKMADEQPILLHRVLRDSLEAALKRVATAEDPIGENTKRLQGLFDLTDTEREILHFAGHRSQSGYVRGLAKRLTGSGYPGAVSHIATMLDRPVQEVFRALKPCGKLLSHDLIQVDRTPVDLEQLVGLPERLMDCIAERSDSLEALVRHFLAPAGVPSLELQAFPHLEEDAGAIEALLRGTRSKGERGVNVLVYGAPGTGKTEFVKALASSVGASLYEIASTDDNGAALERPARLASLHVSQQFLAKHPESLLIFDEIEDVFYAPGRTSAMDPFARRKDTFGKAWMNRVLESNPVPVIWVSNSIEHIDPAFLRRFTYHLEVRTPPLAVRHRIAQRYLRTTAVSDEFIRRVADVPDLTPALIENAARVVNLCGVTELGAAEQLAAQVIRRGQEVTSGEGPSPLRGTPTAYSLAFLNVESRYPLEGIVDALKKSPSASICLYGPPGTGKSALARHISDVVGQPLLVKRASDILSKWVGESERNIADMFREATAARAVLFVDEADSLFARRDDAQRRWEVSQVNELLQQMEQFEGIFLCATNLFDNIDPAALRRFSFKIALKAMTVEQRVDMFVQEALDGQGEALESAHRHRLARLSSLVPGDFAVVKRQARLMQAKPTAEAFLAELEQECRLKPGAPVARIGFVTAD